jgi:hypothetical protein
LADERRRLSLPRSEANRLAITIGTAIVGALMRHVEPVPYANVLAAVLPTPGLVAFYARHGFRPQSVETPILQRWINRSDDQPDRCA